MTVRVEILYFIASALFILGLRGLIAAHTARHGLILAEIGMVFAVWGTLLCSTKTFRPNRRSAARAPRYGGFTGTPQ